MLAGDLQESLTQAKPRQRAARADHLGHNAYDLPADSHRVIVLARLEVRVDRIPVVPERRRPLALYEIEIPRPILEPRRVATGRLSELLLDTLQILARHDLLRFRRFSVASARVEDSLKKPEHPRKP